MGRFGPFFLSASLRNGTSARVSSPPYPDDPDIASAIRLKSMVCLRPVAETAVASPALANDFCAFAADALPLLKWGWDALADSR